MFRLAISIPSGEELIRQLRRLSNVPIFVITGERAFRHEISKVIEETNISIVIKPVDEVILAAQMSQAIWNRA